MSKKEVKKEPKKETKKAEDISSPKDITEFLNSTFDGFRVIEANSADNIERIPSGIDELDAALGGGYAKGKIIEIFGPQSSGKTWILSKCYAANQKKGSICAHIDLESSYSLSFAEDHGVDLSKLIYKDTGENDYAENVFAQIEAICKLGKVSVIGVDSLAALVPKEMLEGSYEDRSIGLVARVISQSIKRISTIANIHGTTIIFINQQRNAIGQFSMHGTPTSTTGGKSVEYYTTQRIEATKSMPPKSERPDLYNDEAEPIAHIIKMKVVKNKTFPPFKKCESLLRYCPLSISQELVASAMKSNLIEKNAKNHKKLTYKGNEIEIEEKNNYQMIWDALRELDLAVDLVITMGEESCMDKILLLDEITKLEVEKYFANKKT